MQALTVLIPIYYKEKAEHFRACLGSILAQTVLPEEVLIVCDGPLTAELDQVLADYHKSAPRQFTILRLPENRGLGEALNAGVTASRNDLIARMDSDDICLPNRFEVQLSRLEKEPELGLLGGQIEEFASDPDEILARREVPCSHEEICRFLKKRNPFNHMTVLYRREAVKKAGGYQHFEGFEDYYLWARMILSGCKAANVPQVVVKARAGEGLVARRGGFSYGLSGVRFQKYLRQSGLISRREFLMNAVVRMGGSLLPGKMRGWLYQKALRKAAKK